MKEVIERCNWLVNNCEDMAITPDVKDDVRYLLEEIEKLKEENEQLKKELQTLKMSEEEWLDKKIGVDKE